MLRSRAFRSPLIRYFLGAICVLLILLNVIILKSCSWPDEFLWSKNSGPTVQNPLRESEKSYVVYGKDIDSGYLRHVFDVLHLYGYRRVSLSESQDWDLLWAHEYPFKALPRLKSLMPHQKVNHFPGSGYITNKMDLSISNIPFTPKAFKLPMDKDLFSKHVSAHPISKLVVKSNDHRGIKIVGVDAINFNETGVFIQEYVDNPLLVDGYKFDIGIYTIITSLDPLRVYIYNGDALFRYCTVEYHPFDPSITDKYVIGDDYRPTWEVPSLKRYYTQLGFSMKESFNAYLKDLSLDPKKIWNNIEEAIRVVCTRRERYMVQILNNYKSRRNFFEMMRFDFVVDKFLNVFLMEVNMSPNLSSAHFKPNRILYEQVLYNLFSLVGLGITHRIDLDRSGAVDLKNVVVPSAGCKNCTDCRSAQCQLCLPCLSSNWLDTLKLSYLEHMNRKDCKRVFPCDLNPNNAKYYSEFSPNNTLLKKWYHAKCEEDSSWCC